MIVKVCSMGRLNDVQISYWWRRPAFTLWDGRYGGDWLILSSCVFCEDSAHTPPFRGWLSCFAAGFKRFDCLLRLKTSLELRVAGFLVARTRSRLFICKAYSWTATSRSKHRFIFWLFTASSTFSFLCSSKQDRRSCIMLYLHCPYRKRSSSPSILAGFGEWGKWAGVAWVLAAGVATTSSSNRCDPQGWPLHLGKNTGGWAGYSGQCKKYQNQDGGHLFQ